MASTMVSEWCSQGFVHPQYVSLFLWRVVMLRAWLLAKAWDAGDWALAPFDARP